MSKDIKKNTVSTPSSLSSANCSSILSNNFQNFDNSMNPITEEIKKQNFKYSMSKFERDLYFDESNKIEKVIRVKRFQLPNNGERWKIFEDNKVCMIIEGTSLSKSIRVFLRTVEGVNFLINEYKNGINSLTSLKNKIREYLKK
jgi:hypothetical protein